MMTETLPPARPRAMTRLRERKASSIAGRWALRALSIAVGFLLWQAASKGHWHVLGARFENVPAPTEVLEAARDLWHSPKFFGHVRASIFRISVGFSIASVLAVGAGLLIGRFRLAADGLLPPLEVLRPIPAVAWIPLSILLWPTAEGSMIFITFIGAFFPILLNTIHGVESIDGRLIQASQVFGVSRLGLFREIIFPGALPSIVTGLSIGMGTAWFSLITAEMVSGQFGIGYFTWEAYTLQNYPDIVLGMVLIGFLGMVSSGLLKVVGLRLMPWFQSRGNAT